MALGLISTVPLGRRSLRWAVSQLQEGFLAEDDFGAQDDYQRELDEEAEFEQQRLDAERRNAAENVAGITLLQEGTNKSSLLSSLGVSQCYALLVVWWCQSEIVMCVSQARHVLRAAVAPQSHVWKVTLLGYHPLS